MLRTLQASFANKYLFPVSRKFNDNFQYNSISNSKNAYVPKDSFVAVSLKFGAQKQEENQELINTIRRSLLRLQAGSSTKELPEAFTYLNLVKCYPKLEDLLNHRYIPIDTPELIAERMRILKVHHNFYTKTGFLETSEIDTPERKELRQDIADNLYGSGAKTHNRQVYFLIGISGAGKSTVSQLLVQEHGAKQIDNDAIRPRIPEYNTTHCTELCFKECSLIKQAMIQKAVENGDNIVIPSVPLSPDGILNQFSFLKNHNYQGHLILIDTPAKQAIERVLKRYDQTKRWAVIFDMDLLSDIPKSIYEEFKKQRIFQSYQRYDNKGKEPFLAENLVYKI